MDFSSPDNVFLENSSGEENLFVSDTTTDNETYRESKTKRIYK